MTIPPAGEPWPLQPPTAPPSVGTYQPEPGYVPAWAPAPIAPPQPPPRPAQRWGCGDIVYGLGLAQLIGVAFVLPLILSGFEEDSVQVTAMGILATWISLGGWALFSSWVRGLGSLKLDFAWEFRWYDVFIGFGLTLAMFFLSILLSGVQRLFHVEEASNTGFLQNEQKSGAGWVYFGLILMVAVGTPIVEELFFRGLTYSAFERRFGPAIAVIGSAVIFGLGHFQPGSIVSVLFLVLTLTVFGAVLGLSRWYFKRCGPGVWSHLFFNLTAALLILAGATN